MKYFTYECIDTHGVGVASPGAAECGNSRRGVGCWDQRRHGIAARGADGLRRSFRCAWLALAVRFYQCGATLSGTRTLRRTLGRPRHTSLEPAVSSRAEDRGGIHSSVGLAPSVFQDAPHSKHHYQLATNHSIGTTPSRASCDTWRGLIWSASPDTSRSELCRWLRRRSMTCISALFDSPWVWRFLTYANYTPRTVISTVVGAT
jgi:hypothetical protein